jgi:hypothetical protein
MPDPPTPRELALLAFARDYPDPTREEREQRLLETFDGDEEEVARFLDRLSGSGQG